MMVNQSLLCLDLFQCGLILALSITSIYKVMNDVTTFVQKYVSAHMQI